MVGRKNQVMIWSSVPTRRALQYVEQGSCWPELFCPEGRLRRYWSGYARPDRKGRALSHPEPRAWSGQRSTDPPSVHNRPPNCAPSCENSWELRWAVAGEIVVVAVVLLGGLRAEQ